jgi:Na+-driven multidrug efflux pump
MEYRNTRQSALLDSKFWEFFVPTILMGMTTTMSIVVDSIIVGNMLGADALAAVNLVMPVMMAYTTVAVCLGLGASTAISVAKGRRQEEYAGSIFTAALAAMLLIGTLLLLTQELFLAEISRVLTAEPTLQPLVRSYLHALVYGTPVIITTLGLSYCLRVDSRVRLAAAVLIVSNLVNLALDLLYMGPFGLGIAGSSLATVSGYLTGAVLLSSYAFSRSRTLRIVRRVVTTPSRLMKLVREIVATGSPAALGSVLIMLKILCINTIVLDVAGKSGMVAFSVCLSCLSLVSMFISGAAQAMTPIVGVLFGQGDYSGVKIVVKRAAMLLVTATLAAILVMETVPGLILQLFGVSHPADIAAGVHAIRVFAVSLAGTSVSFLAMYYYMTIGCRKLSNAIAVMQGFIVVIPAAYILSRTMGATGVWVAFSLAEITTLVMIHVWTRHAVSRHPERYRDIFLLDQEQVPQGERLEMTSDGSASDVDGAMQNLTAFLTCEGVSADTRSTVRTGVEATLSTLAAGACPDGRDGRIDIMLRILDETVVVTMRDNGRDFDETSDAGFSKAHALASTLERSQAIGFNNTTLTFLRTRARNAASQQQPLQEQACSQ